MPRSGSLSTRTAGGRNDLIIWDNRCTMHRGMPFDDQRRPRDMQRATVADVGPTMDEATIASPRPLVNFAA